MNPAKQLAAMGFDPDQIAAATCHGKPLDLEEKPHKLDGMNKTEALFSAELDQLVREGIVNRYYFASHKFRLAKKTWYCPDFVVERYGHRVECVEIKGFLRDDAAVKFKVAREMYPAYKWRMIRRTKTGWEEIL